MTDAEFDEFIANADRSRGKSFCHIWTGTLMPGKFRYGIWKSAMAHRIAYELKNGPIPPGSIIRHKCDNPSCCNPAHLVLGDHVDNRMDCVERGRQIKHDHHPHAKLTSRQVRFIRTHHKGWTHEAIAKKYNVSRSLITRIRNGQAWKGVGTARAVEPRNTS